MSTATHYNGEPEHNTTSILCWCAPYFEGCGDTAVIVHRSLAELIREAQLEGMREANREVIGRIAAAIAVRLEALKW